MAPDNTTTQTTPGVMPTVKNADGTTINSGGASGRLATADHVAPVIHQPASFTPPVNGSPASRRNPLTRETTEQTQTQDTALGTYQH